MPISIRCETQVTLRDLTLTARSEPKLMSFTCLFEMSILVVDLKGYPY